MINEILIFLLLPVFNLFRKKPKNEPARLLVIQMAKIGDFINSSLIFEGLRKRYPKSQLTVLVSEMLGPLAASNPLIDAVVSVDLSKFRGISGRLQFAKIIKKQNCDLVLSLNCNSLVAAACVVSRVPMRIAVLGWKKSILRAMRKFYWDSFVVHRPERLINQSYNDILSFVGASFDVHAFRNEMHIREHGLKNTKIQFQADKKYVGIGISSANKLKELPINKMKQVISSLLSLSEQVHVVLIGTLEDKAKGSDLICLEDRISLIAGDYTLEDLPYLIKGLFLYVGVDSGLTYMADALGVPVVSISGPCNMAETRPLGQKARIVQNLGLPCMPCSYIHNTAHSCRVGTLACINSIEVDEIMSAIRQVINFGSLK